jgi:hypothetical protein
MTDDQMVAFEDELDRLGAEGVARALGFWGPALRENLVEAFRSLSDEDSAQALRVLKMTRW